MEQLALLHRVSGIVSSGLKPDDMLEELVSLVVSVTNCDACLVYLLDPAAGEVVLRASQIPHSGEIGNIRMKVGEGVTGWVAQHQSVVALSSSASVDPRFKSFSALPEDGYEAFLSVPLISGGIVIGVINVHHKQVHMHSPDEIGLMRYIAEQMGGAIAKTRLEERSQDALRKFERLALVCRTIGSDAYLDRILQTITEMVSDTFDSPVCSIMIVDESKQELSIQAARCSSPEYLQKPPIKIENSLIGRVVRDHQYVTVPDVALEKLYRYPELARRNGLASLLSVPLFTGKNVIGTLNIYTKEKKAFSEEEIGFAQAVAVQAAMAYENARLMAETLQMKQMLESRKLMERAKGILQRSDGMSEEEAYLHLRDESRRLRRPVKDLAEAIILAEELHRRGGRKDEGPQSG